MFCHSLLLTQAPLGVDDKLPHKMFGNFKGCNGDKWPSRMCSLKSIKDPKTPKITSTSRCQTNGRFCLTCRQSQQPEPLHFTEELGKHTVFHP
jgi:hypothetical protein